MGEGTWGKWGRERERSMEEGKRLRSVKEEGGGRIGGDRERGRGEEGRRKGRATVNTDDLEREIEGEEARAQGIDMGLYF